MPARSDRIVECLKRAGLTTTPLDPSARLADYGLDSLKQALTILEIEKEFGLRVPFSQMKSENFETLARLDTWVAGLTG